VLAVVASTVLLGCASFRAVDPTRDRIDVGSDEGLVVVVVETDVTIDSLTASGGKLVGPLPPGRHIHFVVARAGRYRFDRIWRRLGYYRPYYNLLGDADDFGFEVRAGQINYPGALLIEGAGRYPHIAIRLTNRSGMLLREMERDHPRLLEQWPLRYTGRGRDRFLQALEKRRRPGSPAASTAAGHAAHGAPQ